jgi:hypothetical protein
MPSPVLNTKNYIKVRINTLPSYDLSGSTGFLVMKSTSKTDTFFKSKVIKESVLFDSNQLGTLHNRSNKSYIKYTNLITRQFNDLSDYYDGISLDLIKSETRGVISNLISLDPDAFSLELTGDRSIFYTFKKNDFSFYIQQFFETEEDGFNATLVLFKGDEKIDNITGNIEEIYDVVQYCIKDTITQDSIYVSIDGIISY